MLYEIIQDNEIFGPDIETQIASQDADKNQWEHPLKYMGTGSTHQLLIILGLYKNIVKVRYRIRGYEDDEILKEGIITVPGTMNSSASKIATYICEQLSIIFLSTLPEIQQEYIDSQWDSISKDKEK